MVRPTQRRVWAQPSAIVARSMAIAVPPRNTAQSTTAAKQISAPARWRRSQSVEMAAVGKGRRVKEARSETVAPVMGIVARLLITVLLQVDVRVSLGAALESVQTVWTC